MQRNLIRAAVAALGATAVVIGATTAGEAAGGGEQSQSERPNIVVLMTDDQTVESLRVMPTLASKLADKGVSFANSFASNPVCCPSRSTFLTGQYSHNNGVYRNSGDNGGYRALDSSETLPVWLQRAGYQTAHIGKYLNGYGTDDPTEIPPGWSEWYGSVDNSTYQMYGYTLNENGILVTYGDPATEDAANYQTDVYAAKAGDYIERHASDEAPFFLSLAPLAPHAEVNPEAEGGAIGGPRAAPRHEGAFAGEALPTPPSFNEADVTDKPAEIRALEPLSANDQARQQLRYRDRLESLLAVDEMIGGLIETLRETGELDRTVFMFTADNGFLLGEHRIAGKKQYLYEESIRVPLIIRGPEIPKGKTRKQPVANIDLAPTILHFAEADPGRLIDGRSLHKLIDDRRLQPGRALVIENWCQRGEGCYDPAVARYRAVRTQRYIYAEYPNGELEMYDLDADPYELASVHADPAYAAERAALAELLAQTLDCAGGDCKRKPRLKLALDYEREREDGKRCVSSKVRLKVKGADSDEALEARFFVDGRKRGSDPDPPLREQLARSDLRGRKQEIAAEVAVLDGRLRTVSEQIPGRC